MNREELIVRLMNVAENYKYGYIYGRGALTDIGVLVDEYTETVVKNYSEHNVVVQSEQLNCDHEWRVDTFDCYGFPTEKYCDKCDKKQAI